MAGITFPGEDVLPPGAHRDLLVAVHELYRKAGLPGLRVLAADIAADDDCPATISHEGISALLRGKSLPRWAKVESLARVLAKRGVDRPDHQAVVGRIHLL